MKKRTIISVFLGLTFSITAFATEEDRALTPTQKANVVMNSCNKPGRDESRQCLVQQSNQTLSEFIDLYMQKKEELKSAQLSYTEKQAGLDAISSVYNLKFSASTNCKPDPMSAFEGSTAISYCQILNNFEAIEKLDQIQF